MASPTPSRVKRVEQVEEEVAGVLETAAAMADALATMDASTAKQARTKSVDIVESVEHIRRQLHALVDETG